MESCPGLLLDTIILRPYVFIFLLIYLLGCSFHLGLRRAVVFAFAGYAITWLSEYSSIHNGIPYGYYRYVADTKGRELWMLGVPFMDSLSYVFLSYASFSLAVFTRSPVLCKGSRLYVLETLKIRHSLLTTFLGALFMMYLDIIIDPVALRGDRWFLGKIHEYPGGGEYFGVPMTNFIGWFAVGFVLIAALQRIDSYLSGRKDIVGNTRLPRLFAGPALYCLVIIFNVYVTFSIEEYALGWAGIFIVLLPTALLLYLTVMKLSCPGNEDADLAAHLADFPSMRIKDKEP